MDKYKNIWEPVYREFEEYHPYLSEKVIDWYPSGQMEITVRLLDGDKICYDWFDKRIKRIYSPRVNDSLSDEEIWRIDFSTKLYNKMRKFGMSQNRLSELTDISTVTISKYISGKATPSGYNIDKIAKALRCSPSEFLHNI